MTEHQMTKVDLEEALSQGLLEGGQLGEIDCRGIEWGSARVRQCDFKNAHFGNVTFSRTTLEKVNFSGVVLRGAKVSKAQAEVRYEDSDMAESDWSQGQFTQVTVEGCNLANGDLSASRLMECVFKDTDFMRVQLSRSTWMGGGAEDGRLGGANLAGADLSNSVLCDVSLRGANLCGANLANSIWLGVDLTGAELSRAQLADAIWIGCRMEGVQWGETEERPLFTKENLSSMFSQVSRDSMTDLIVYLLGKAGTRLHGGSLRPSGTPLPVPAEYESASFREIISTLQMRLHHPEWMTQLSEGNPGARSPTPGGSSSSPTASVKSEGEPAPKAAESDEPEEGDGRFSLLEID